MPTHLFAFAAIASVIYSAFDPAVPSGWSPSVRAVLGATGRRFTMSVALAAAGLAHVSITMAMAGLLMAAELAVDAPRHRGFIVLAAAGLLVTGLHEFVQSVTARYRNRTGRTGPPAPEALLRFAFVPSLGILAICFATVGLGWQDFEWLTIDFVSASVFGLAFASWLTISRSPLSVWTDSEPSRRVIAGAVLCTLGAVVGSCI